MYIYIYIYVYIYVYIYFFICKTSTCPISCYPLSSAYLDPTLQVGVPLAADGMANEGGFTVEVGCCRCHAANQELAFKTRVLLPTQNGLRFFVLAGPQ